MRVINEANEQLGVLDNREALRLAREAGMDLVEVAPNERPPVCRIMDYGKFKYQQKKNLQKHHHHEQQLKELRIRPKTDVHDLEIRKKQAFRFLQEGDKVQFKMVFRGRERSHREIGTETLNDIIAFLGDLAKVERPPLMDGRDMIMVLAPNKQAFDKLEADQKKAQARAAAVASGAAKVAPESAATAPPAPAPAAASATQPQTA